MVISVIIPTLNEEVNLPVTLRQLSDHPDVELIIVDGGSTDRTINIAQQFTPYVFCPAAAPCGAAHLHRCRVDHERKALERQWRRANHAGELVGDSAFHFARPTA